MEMDEFTKLKVNQLEIARNANILLYYRERASHGLGKKLRSEVGRLFVSTEVKDCMKVLTRLTNENMDSTAIDLAIVEYDASSIKLIDYLNKRPLMQETSNCPLIPVIALVSDESKVHDANESLNSVGGVNKIVHLNAPTKDVLMAIMDVVYNRKRVEDTFRSIKKVRVISSKYPYLPVFGTKASPAKSKEHGVDASQSGSTSLTGADFKLEEIEEVSECASLLPEFLSPVRRSTLPFLRNRTSSALQEDLDEKKIDERQDNHLLDHYKKGESFRSDVHDDNSSGLDKLDIPMPSTVHSNSFLARADSRLSMDDDTKTGATERSKSTTSSIRKPPSKSQAVKLMNPHCRPWWSGSLSTDPVGKTSNANIKYEIHPFVDRDPPTLARPSTVSGLDKLSVSRYWNQLNNVGTGKKSDEAKAISTMKSKSGDPSISESLAQVATEAPFHIDHNKHSAPVSPRSQVHGASISNGTRRPSISGAHSIPSEDGSREYSTFLRLTKQIAQIAKSSTVDFQLNQLMEVDFAHRRINQGEKDMLSRAANLEKDGDVESAIVCYKRAGVHSKDKQLSKLLLGNLSFRQEKFLAALGYYDMALKILQGKSVKLPHDEFLAHYNRAIIQFRLGNDEEGIKDIEKAVAVNPSSIEAREILSIARRRTGKYLQAVDEAAKLKLQRLEKERIERLLTQQSAAVDDSMISSREGSPHRGKRGDASIRTVASKKQGVSFEQSQVSSKIDAGPSVTTYGANSYAIPGFQQPPQRVFNPAYGGVQINIDEPSARTGLREKIIDHRKANKSEDGGNGDGGGALKIFKMNNGYELELFDDLFKKPSDLQYALITAPVDRTLDQHDIIRDTLKMFPFLRKMSSSCVQELAGVVEYRALTGKEQLFVQNEESAVTCLLLNGHVQVRMDASYGSTMMDVVLGDLKAFSSFAYVDLLFRKPRPQLRTALEEALFPHYAKQCKQNPNSNSTTIEQHDADSSDEKSVSTVGGEEDGELMGKFAKEFQEFWETTPMRRSVSPGMFMTYTMQSPCEFLMIPEYEYNRVMMDHALEELKARIGALISCGIFKDWQYEDLIRLARMSQIKFYKGGETILQQGTKPPALGIVMKGLCKVIKKPNRTEMLYQKLNVALEKADQHDLKYVYHHRVSKGVLVPKTAEEKRSKVSYGKDKNRSRSPNQKSKHHYQRQDPIAILKNFSTTVYCEPMAPTEPEIFRKELQAEIDKLQQLIQKAKLQDAMDWREDRTTNTQSKSANNNHYDLVRSDHPSKVNELAGFLSGSIAEIATLQWPMLFGEACILDPENGISRGSVIADTACEVLMLHKVQIQTFPVDADFLDRVRGKAIAYPHDPDLVVNLYRDIEWKHFKEELMGGIATNRWPKKFDTHEPFTI